MIQNDCNCNVACFVSFKWLIQINFYYLTRVCVFCLVPSSSTETTTTTPVLSAGSLIAITTIASMAIIIVVIVGGFWYHKKWKAKHVSPEVIDKLPKVEKFDRMGSFVSDDSLVSCYSPYPTVSEIAFTRFGPSPIPDDDEGVSLSDSDPEFTYMDNPHIKPPPKDRYHDFPDENEFVHPRTASFTHPRTASHGDYFPKQEEKFLYGDHDDSMFLGVQPVRDEFGNYTFRPITRGTDGSLSSLSEQGENSQDLERLTNVEEESVAGSYPEVPAIIRLPEVTEESSLANGDVSYIREESSLANGDVSYIRVESSLANGNVSYIREESREIDDVQDDATQTNGVLQIPSW